MIIRNPIYKNCSTYCAGSGTKTRTKRHVFVSQWWWFTWADQTQTSDHVPAAAAAAQQHQVWRPALLSSELKSPSFLLHTESGQEVSTSDVLYLHEMLVSCSWPAKVPPAASVRVLTTEYQWWPAVQQCGVQCAVQTAASPPTRHHQDSVSRETGDVRTPRTSLHNTPLSPKHTTYPVWYLPPLSTECQILTTSRHAGPDWARGHNSPLPPQISKWEKIKQILSLHLTWQSAGGQACQCPLFTNVIIGGKKHDCFHPQRCRWSDWSAGFWWQTRVGKMGALIF